MKSQKAISRIINALRRMYPGPFFGSSVSEDPFQILIGTVLSQRTKDANAISASNKLFSKYGTPKKLASADPKQVGKLIKETGFYKTKAKRIIAISRILLEKYGGKVPSTMTELVSLPGVGRKTANIVLLYSFDMECIPVDTHVHKVSNRLGLVKTRTPEKTEIGLMGVVPRRYWKDINELFVQHGQQICLSQRPKCDLCGIRTYCDYYKNIYKKANRR